MKRVILMTWGLVFCLASAGWADQLRPRKISVKPERAVVAHGYDRNHVEVKFIDGADIGLSEENVPYDRSALLLKSSGSQSLMAAIQAAGGSWRRMPGPSEELVDSWVTTAEEN